MERAFMRVVGAGAPWWLLVACGVDSSDAPAVDTPGGDEPADTDPTQAETDVGEVDDSDPSDDGGAESVLGELVYVPPGTFTMGCISERDISGPPASCNDYASAHEVTLTRGFMSMKAEFTQRQWGDLGLSNPSFFAFDVGGINQAAEHPSESFNFWEALLVANAASAADGLPACYTLSGCSGTVGAGCVGPDCMVPTCSGVTVNAPEGKTYNCEGWRLPSEAEWEYSARAGSDHRYAGSNRVGDVAWYGSNSDEGTHPACSKDANAWGLCDHSGNVWEFVWGRRTFSSRPTTDPEGPVDPNDIYVLARGSSWRSRDPLILSRELVNKDQRSYMYGFRLVRTVDRP